MGDERSFRVLSILDEDPVALEGGALQWIPLRRRLGIGAFGTNAYRVAKTGDTVIEEHIESPGQEELYVVISGRVKFEIGDEEVVAAAGGAIFIAEPELKRHGVALEDDTAVLAVGGWRDKPYHSLPWEPIYLAQEAMRAGDWATAAETIEREAGEQRDSAPVRYRLAVCRAHNGEDGAAIEELRRAIEVNPGLHERAESEAAFASLREGDAWASLG